MKKLLLVLLISIFVICGCNDKDYFVPIVQVSDCNLDGDNFVEVLCEKWGIDDANDFWRIECPKCPSGDWVEGMGYNKVDFGAYVEQSDALTMCLFYGVPEGTEGIPAGTYCGQCGYQIGYDWTVRRE